MFPYIIAGLTVGSVFALAAIGLVLTYKTSGIFNLAHGAIASASAFLFYALREVQGLAWPLAAALSVLLGGVVLGLLIEFGARFLSGARLTNKILMSVGILLTIQGLLQLAFEPGTFREVNQFLPESTVDVFGTPVAAYQLIIMGSTLVAAVALTLFLRYHRTGVAMRAVVDNPELLEVMGTSAPRVRRLAWMIGCSMASASGVLLAPLLPLDATTITLLVVTAFGAAAVGAFTNLPLTYLGGLAIGVGQAILQKTFFDSTGIESGLATSLPFLVLFALLVLAPRLKRPSMSSVPRMTTADTWRAPARVRLGGVVLLLGFLLLVPEFAGLHLIDWTRFLAYVILFLSLGLLVKASGQVSLAHVSFMAIGVCAFSHLAVDRGWPWLVALLFAAAVAAPVGALLAVPAIRFPGLYLALATLGFGILLQQMFYRTDWMFGQYSFGLLVPQPTLNLFGWDPGRTYYYVVLLITVAAGLLVFGLTRSRLGRLLNAMSDSPAGLQASGASINVTRVLVFCLSASMAAVAGVLDGGALLIVGPEGYAPMLSLQLFAVIMLTVGGTPWFAVVGAAAQVVIPSYITTDATVTYVFTLIFGVSAIYMSIAPPPEVPKWMRSALDRLGRTRNGTRKAREVAKPVYPAVTGTGLAVEELVVRYGGLVAVDHVGLRAEPGRITGLIGPNGAGKSTVFNACSGTVRPASGTVALDETTLRRLGPPARARRGLGRTFQHMELFDSLSARQNVALGVEGAYAGWNPMRHVLTTPRQSRETVQRTAHALELCGLTDLAESSAGSLSTGQRRLVELARCIAGGHNLLLLDEPSSGLDRVETERFGEILMRVVEERGVGILLIEHDMALVNKVCDYVYVIDFGKPLFEGPVAEVGASPLVRAAYLGESDTLTSDLSTTGARA